LDLENEDPEFLEDFNLVIDDDDVKHADETFDMEVGEDDPYLNMELGLPRGEDEELKHAHVKRRAVDVEGRPIGRPSTNPLLDSRQYEVEFMDGEVEILTANIIAENLLAQVDEEGHRQMLIEEIEDHRTLEDAIPIEGGRIYHPVRHEEKAPNYEGLGTLRQVERWVFNLDSPERFKRYLPSRTGRLCNQ
jgi:hypothetical protein